MRSSGIHEIILVVEDVKRAAQFYRDVVGLIPRGEPTEQWAAFATISLDHPQWLGLTKGPLLFEEFSPLPEGRRFGPIHYAMRASETSPEAFLETARLNGLSVYGPQQWEGRMKGVSYYFYDPDSNLVEFWYPD